jgi:hypothetical protein
VTEFGGPRRDPPSGDDGMPMVCPVCQGPFAPSGRRVYCSAACKASAYRRRQGARAPEPLPPVRLRRPLTVYECGSCGERAVGEQYCEDCGTFRSRVGLGGLCPNCDEPVAVSDLLPKEVLPTAMG